MAFPVILFNSSTGSDTAASGAGPATALTGTDASTSASGLVVTLDGSPDLSGVATDGTHAIYLADTTAGKRNFGRITASDDTAKTVTVATAFDVSLTGKSWAIGGKRLTLEDTASRKLFNNNSAAGDAMPGWIMEMESGFTDTLASTLEWRRAGSNTDGPIILRGVSGAATRPIITFTNNGRGFDLWNTHYKRITDFDIINTNATKTASVAIGDQASKSSAIERMKIADSTNNFWRAGGTSFATWRMCDIGYTASHGLYILTSNNLAPSLLTDSWIHDCGGSGLFGTGINESLIILGCLFTNNAAYGLELLNVPNVHVLRNNTFYNNTSGGVYADSSTLGATAEFVLINNIFANNGGYGINSTATLERWQSSAMMRGNTFFTNTSGKYTPDLATLSVDEQTADPAFTNAGGDDWSIGTALKALGYPLGGSLFIGMNSATYSYVDIGAAQRQEPAGGGSVAGSMQHTGFGRAATY